MKKKRISLLRGIAVCVNAAAAAVLAVGFVAGMRAGYGSETWKEILGGKNYVETAEFQEQAASSVYDALEAAVRDSRMEKDGQYDPQRIIRLRDYLDNGTIYDEMSEKEKGNGICYRLGDLYQWSLKGTSYSDDVLNESYKPAFLWKHSGVLQRMRRGIQSCCRSACEIHETDSEGSSSLSGAAEELVGTGHECEVSVVGSWKWKRIYQYRFLAE